MFTLIFLMPFHPSVSEKILLFFQSPVSSSPYLDVPAISGPEGRRVYVSLTLSTLGISFPSTWDGSKAKEAGSSSCDISQLLEKRLPRMNTSGEGRHGGARFSSLSHFFCRGRMHSLERKEGRILGAPPLLKERWLI